MAKKTIEELFQAPAQIMKLETMADGGIRIVIDTQELEDSQELVKLFRLKKGSIGWFLFKSSQIKQGDIPDADVEPDEEDGKKSQSKRLYNVLFVYWKEVKGGKGDFQAFYRSIMEQLIDNYKAKLPPRDDDDRRG